MASTMQNSTPLAEETQNKENDSLNMEVDCEQFHDCHSQPTSPNPKVKQGTTTVQSVPVEKVSSNDSSKENSPRPATGNGTSEVKVIALDKKAKKKEDRNIEHVLKALSSLSSPEEKLAALCKKYTELLEEHRTNGSSLKVASKKVAQTSKERDTLQTENSKLILAKSKLESLCRELQRQNKVIKDESLARQREEEEKRKEVSSKFQVTITDIQTQMESHSKRNDKLREDNQDLTEKLKKLLEQYEMREEHIQKLLKQKELETQLMEAKFNQCQLMIQQEQEKGGKEKQMLLEKLIESKTHQEAMTDTEAHLKNQLSVYTDKYAEFESTLNKSNEVFASFKTEMEKMTKKIKKLEKDSMTYKQRWENSNRALLEMVEQKQQHDRLLDATTKKCKQLESLCRAMQAKRAVSEATGETSTEVKDNETMEQTETEGRTVDGAGEECSSELKEDVPTETVSGDTETKPSVDQPEANLPPTIPNETAATTDPIETSEVCDAQSS